MAVPSISVANFFVKKALDDGMDLTPMKLVKLVYIAHGWHLGLHSEPLLGEAVEAWKYGPVVPTVYHKFKGYRDSPIRKQAIFVDGNRVIIPEIEDEEVQLFLDDVWRAYRNFSALQLSTMTHKKDTPWHQVWKEQGGSEMLGAVIPNHIIEEHYKRLADR